MLGAVAFFERAITVQLTCAGESAESSGVAMVEKSSARATSLGIGNEQG